MLKYPLGIQTFEEIRLNGYAYVDKTKYIHQLASEGKYFFLSRPRRFGKSLLLSTLEAYFKGRKDLFKGLAIEGLEKEWLEHPVLHLDFSGCIADKQIKLEEYIYAALEGYANAYGIELRGKELGLGPVFGYFIRDLTVKTGRKTVILIDEYDKGLQELLHNQEELEENIKLLRPFFSQLKTQDAYIKFAMVTGVGRFRHLTLFSGANNLADISMHYAYASICGITQTELEHYFKEGIQTLADRQKSSIGDTIENLRLQYDSYRFTDEEETVYNPFSLMSALYNCRIEPYWLQTGTSNTFVRYLKNTHFELTRLEEIWATEGELASLYSNDNHVPLLYQTGYLTITDYNEGLYKLGIPNGEVRYALTNQLLPIYLGISSNDLDYQYMLIKGMVNRGDVDGFMKELQILVSKIPYHLLEANNLEKTYHLVVYSIFMMLGVNTHCEIAISGGRIDMVAETINYAYVIEFKLGHSCEEALKQINDKGYATPYAGKNKDVYKIGVSFSRDTRTIEGWIYEKA